jgi:hypothetical protein
LEHETWQELTGYDAVSTVRGIQIAMANSANMLTLGSTTDLQNQYGNWGFSSSVPSGFTQKIFYMFTTYSSINARFPSTEYAWTNPTAPSSFDIMSPTVFTSNFSSIGYPINAAVLSEIQTYTYDPTSQFYYYYCLNYTNNLVNNLRSNPSAAAGTDCLGNAYAAGSSGTVVIEVANDWINTVIPYLDTVITDQYTFFNNSVSGFVPSYFIYRPNPQAASQYSTATIGGIRNDFASGATVSYTMPSTTVSTQYDIFEVYIRKQTNTSAGTIDYGFAIKNLGQ